MPRFTPATQKVVDLLMVRSDRDRQRRIGPSELGNPCARCLAERLLGLRPPDKDIALAPLIGTAMHALLEHRSGLLEVGKGILTETKVNVGEVRGYGKVTGSCDRYDIEKHQVIDYKVVAKKKVKAYQSAVVATGSGEVFFDDDNPVSSTLKQYYTQLNLYGKGMVNAGEQVKNVALLFITRDASAEQLPQGLTELVFKLNMEVADQALERASNIYEWATSPGNSVDDIDSDPGCYYCRYRRGKEELDIF